MVPREALTICCCRTLNSITQSDPESFHNACSSTPILTVWRLTFQSVDTVSWQLINIAPIKVCRLPPSHWNKQTFLLSFSNVLGALEAPQVKCPCTTITLKSSCLDTNVEAPRVCRPASLSYRDAHNLHSSGTNVKIKDNDKPWAYYVFFSVYCCCICWKERWDH